MGEYMFIAYKGYSIEVEHSVSIGYHYLISKLENPLYGKPGFAEPKMAVQDAKRWIDDQEAE